MFAYSFVPSLLLVSLNIPGVSLTDRIFLLQVCYYFLGIYETGTEGRNILKEKKSKYDPHIRLYDIALIKDVSSSIIAILSLLQSDNYQSVYLHRLGSHPVEHFFGLVRSLSKNEHTFQKMKRVITKNDILTTIKAAYGIGTRIEGRIATLGVNIVKNESLESTVFSSDPREIATSVMMTIGYPVSSSMDFRLKSLDQIPNIATAQFNTKQLLIQLSNFISPLSNDRGKRKRSLSMRSLEVTDISAIISRLEKKNSFITDNTNHDYHGV
jgi:hypothetical protein